MIVTSTGALIAAPPAAIYAYAAATERWPLILPHYRYVRVLESDGDRRIVEMAAWRDCFPLHWIAEQHNDPRRPSIGFRHIAGPARGMDVTWAFEPAGERTRVTIEHRLDFAFPVFADLLGRYVVSGYFIEGVARRTLACMQQLAQAAGGR